MSHRLLSVIIIVCAIFLAFFVYPAAWNKLADQVHAPHLPDWRPFRLGLDLLGGTHLVYQADLAKSAATSGADALDQSAADAMAGVRDVIERRVNLFGVAEPLVQIEGNNRLVVELAGIKDVNQAIQLIGLTPFLEFREQRSEAEIKAIEEARQRGQRLNEDVFQPTGLTGQQVKSAQVNFDPNTGQPEVLLNLNSDGAKLFAEITKRNIGKQVAIYLDGQPISIPVVQTEIPDGRAVISGGFNIQEAKELANRLNAGALPVPITLISQQTVGASLGYDSLQKSLKAGLYGLLAVALFMILYYRLPGIVSVLALLIYTVLVLTIYKIFPVTLTLAGIAGFILSLGMAVDANVLIFARMREELKTGKTLTQAVNEGFRRAWLSIRDSHVTALLGAVVLYIFTTSFVKGFALTLGIGVLASLFSAIIVTRSFLDVFISSWFERKKWLF
ncbi:MAG: protein translocase subunit SecD [Patescibacteria group bacterium]